jgi:YkoY family integral membrane protein
MTSTLLAMIRFFGQSFELHDLVIVGLLVILEGVLSVDNALVLGLLAKRVPKKLQHKALTYGLLGALVFRILAIGAASFLLRWNWAKLLGGGYLIYVALKHFFFENAPHPDEHLGVDAAGQPTLIQESTGRPVKLEDGESPLPPPSLTTHSLSFWYAVGVIELTDIAFAVDSIVAAMALIGQQKADDTGAHDKLWVVIVGGFIGVILMRFAAILFIRLLEHFPRLETAAYLLVILIGAKLLADWKFNDPNHPHHLDFHDYHRPEFWVFWLAMVLSFLMGFVPRKKPA